jgi:hypothetical protein
VPRPKPSTVGSLAVSPVPLIDRTQAASYVAALTAELATLVRRHRMRTLAYLLDMARLEAEEILQRGDEGSSSDAKAPPASSGQRK